MKIPQILILFLSLICFPNFFAQPDAEVDRITATYPKRFTTPEQLGQRITADFSTDRARARALYNWIGQHISYDVAQLRSGSGQVGFSYRTEEEKQRKIDAHHQNLAMQALRTRKAICQGYTALYALAGKAAGLEVVSIPGFSKTSAVHIGNMPKVPDHIWNAVKIDGRWDFVDVTWAAGAIHSGTGKFVADFSHAYFAPEPGLFFTNHFPVEEKWRPNGLQASEYANLPLFHPAYLNDPFSIKGPSSGVLPSGRTAVFEIENSREQSIAYTLSRDRTLREVALTSRGDHTVFEIPITARERGHLTLFVGQKPVVTYKIGPVK